MVVAEEVDVTGNTEVDTVEENVADVAENASSTDRFEPERVVEFAAVVCV